jgi:hypothetical protein
MVLIKMRSIEEFGGGAETVNDHQEFAFESRALNGFAMWDEAWRAAKNSCCWMSARFQMHLNTLGTN